MEACFTPPTEDIILSKGVNKCRLKEAVEIALIEGDNAAMFCNPLVKVL
jgi:hypothetical protein